MPFQTGETGGGEGKAAVMHFLFFLNPIAFPAFIPYAHFQAMQDTVSS